MVFIELFDKANHHYPFVLLYELLYHNYKKFREIISYLSIYLHCASHASANVRHPVNQGLSGMLGVFVTTIIVCSCTAFCILLSGQLGSGLPML